MIGSIIRTLLGRSRRAAIAEYAKVERQNEHERSMKILNMKVAALQVGAERLSTECERTQEAAAELLCRLRKDL